MDGSNFSTGQVHGHRGPTFIDLFAGCGGLSLGLCQAGWRGRFAIERASDAFETFRANFLGDDSHFQFDWPEWLETKAHSIEEVLQSKRAEISDLQGTVDLIAGGPPCQGFSFAGKRSASDPRNKMFQKYVQFVALVKPTFLLLENVPGMAVAHSDGRGTRRETYYEKLFEELKNIGYTASRCVLDAADFGVPQRRSRLVVIGVRNDLVGPMNAAEGKRSPSELIDSLFLESKSEGGFQLREFGEQKVSAESAISDLEVTGDGVTIIDYTASDSRSGYRQLHYKGPTTPYQRWMHQGAPESMDSMRLANHSKDVQTRFKKILKASLGRRGVNLSAALREELGMLKHRTVPMDHAKPAPTLTTLPDDILHYQEPRILTVRECARLQSFPDWFVFRGKYTTGGARRRSECPRYTQVGNAVPPLLGRALGVSMARLLQVDDDRAKQPVRAIPHKQQPGRVAAVA